MRGPSPIVLDAGMYWELGGLVADGDWLLMQRPIAYRTPAYPWLIGLFRTVFEEPLFALVCFQGALWVATIGLTTAMAIDLSGTRRIAWIVVGVSVAMISSVTYVATVLTETLFVFLIVSHLWIVSRFCRRPTVAGGVLVGLTLGVAILTRPVAMLVWVADAIYLVTRWYWIQDPSAIALCRKRGWICVALAAIVTVGCVSPWLARNHAMFGKVMLTEFVGRNLWIVTFQEDSGAGLALPRTENGDQLERQLGETSWDRMAGDQTWRETWSVSKALTACGMDDPAGDRLMKAVAIDAIKESPGTFAKKTFRRWINFWRTRATELPTQVADLKPHGQSLANDFAGQPIWGVKVAPVDTAIRYRWSNWLTGNTLLMFATAAATMLLIVCRPTRAVGLWLGATVSYFATVTAVLEIPAYRYRMIVEPVVLLILALALTHLMPPDDQPTPATTPASD